MRIWITAGISVGVALLASSCATLNEDQCNVVDWRTLGQSDGGQGRPQSHVAEHQKACSRFGIAIDASAWNSGWQEGIRTYCTPRNGLSAGLNGRVNRNACLPDQAVAFNEAYDVGSQVHAARSNRDAIQDSLDSLIGALSEATPEQLPAKQAEIERKRNELIFAQLRVSRAEDALNLYQQRLLITPAQN